jgi:hypothetical protein
MGLVSEAVPGDAQGIILFACSAGYGRETPYVVRCRRSSWQCEVALVVVL